MIAARALQALLALALAVPRVAPAQAPSAMLVNEKIMGSASELPGPISQMSAADLEEYNGGLRRGIVRVFEAHGRTLGPDDVTIRSEVIAYRNQSIVRSTIVSVPTKTYQIAFMGIVGDKLVGVFCTAAQPFEASGNACEQQLRKTFAGGTQ